MLRMRLYCSISFISIKLLLFPYFTTDSHRQTPTDRMVFTSFTKHCTQWKKRRGALGSDWNAPFASVILQVKTSKGLKSESEWGLEVTQIIWLTVQRLGNGWGRGTGRQEVSFVQGQTESMWIRLIVFTVFCQVTYQPIEVADLKKCRGPSLRTF